MPTLEQEQLHCEQCGAPLETTASLLGCLNCLLLGGSEEIAAENRRYQHYEVCLRDDGTLCELGRGAMGVTYRALDINLDSPVALKIISAHFSDNPQARERFRREARVAARLRHPNVASVFHFGETEDQKCFYAMELIEGETLEARVRRAGPLSVSEALEVATQVARALMAASTHGLVHRDLKPSNLMIVANDSANIDTMMVKVIDFGLAKAAIETANVSDEIRATFSGTPEFASPEQFTTGKVGLDARSDIYSLGATLWYLLCGKAPFSGGASTEFRAAQVRRQPPLEQLEAARVPSLVVALLRSMMAPDPAARPRSARELLEKLRICHEAIEAKPRRRKRLQLAAGAFLLLVATTFGLTNYFSHRQQAAAIAALPEKSVAVLPFENQNDDKEDVFFADGMQDEVLSSLVKIKELKVIGRSSVMSYRDPTRRNVREIGRQLGVAHVLEANVRRIADRVLLHVSLIDTRDDHQLWAERFDRTLADSVALQGEIATEIAAVLEAKLAPEEKAILETKPTNNPNAYLLYLRARARDTLADAGERDLEAAEQLYHEAIAIDPTFTLAYARASMANSALFGDWPTPERKTKARAQADEALRLSPALGEAHLALGMYFYLVEEKRSDALAQFNIAAKTSPNNADIYRLSGAIHRQQGRWRESIACYERAEQLEPRIADMAVGNGRNYLLVRNWPAAIAAFKRARALDPNSGFVLLWLNTAEYYAGNPAASRVTLEKLPATFQPRAWLLWEQYWMERNLDAAEKVVREFPQTETNKPYCQALISYARGNVDIARELFEKLRPAFEAAVRNNPDDGNRHAQLGMLYAYLGRKEDAVREGRVAVDLFAPSEEPFTRAQIEGILSLIYTRVGDADQAIPLIKRLLVTPGAIMVSKEPNASNITLADLRYRWEWDPLRSDPRFQKILASPEPKTIY